MRSLLAVVLALTVVAMLPGCGGKAAQRKRSADAAAETTSGAQAPTEAGGTETGTGGGTTDGQVETEMELAAVTLPDVDTAKLLGVKTVFAAATLDEDDAGLEAVGTAQLADGQKAEEKRVLALLAALAASAPDARTARVEVWTPGKPDARFAQYLWDRELSRLERFEASIPAQEYAFYTPARDEGSDGEPQGFEASRTGVIDGVDLARLQTLSANVPVWQSDTP